MKRTLESQESAFVGNKVDDKCIICIACWKASTFSTQPKCWTEGGCITRRDILPQLKQALLNRRMIPSHLVHSSKVPHLEHFTYCPAYAFRRAVAAFNADAMFALTASLTIVLITLRFVRVRCYSSSEWLVKV